MATAINNAPKPRKKAAETFDGRQYRCLRLAAFFTFSITFGISLKKGTLPNASKLSVLHLSLLNYKDL